MNKESPTSSSETDTTFENNVEAAIEAMLDKRARNVVVLDLEGICSFSDQFILCSGTSTRQTQAIADGVDEKLRKSRIRPSHIEGYTEGEWILMDYVDFVVHIFTESAREFYDLERLWRSGKRREVKETVGQKA